MTLSRIRVAFCTVLAAVLAAASLPASVQGPLVGRETSAASVASYSLSQQMPVDPEVVLGTLPNGLRYYVRANGSSSAERSCRGTHVGKGRSIYGSLHPSEGNATQPFLLEITQPISLDTDLIGGVISAALAT